MPVSVRSAVARSSLGRPEHQVGEGERVDAHVQQRPAAEAGVEQPVARRPARPRSRARRAPAAACRTRRPRAASRTLADHRVAGHPHRLHQEPVVLAARAANISSASAVSRVSGFSHSTCLPASRASRVLLEVQGVRGGDVHDVDVGVGHQRLVGAVRRASAAVLLRRRPRPTPGVREPDRGEPRRPGTARRSRGEACGRSCRWPGCPSRSCPSCRPSLSGCATPET